MADSTFPAVRIIEGGRFMTGLTVQNPVQIRGTMENARPEAVFIHPFKGVAGRPSSMA